MTVKRKHLLGLEELDASEIMSFLESAKVFREVLERPIKKVAPLRGLKKQKTSGVAKVAVARRLAVRLFWMLRTRQ